MENKIKTASKRSAVINWSGGKDCTMALFRSLKADRYDIKSLLTTVNDKYGRITMHGVRESLVEQQAQRLGIPLVKVAMPDEPTMEIYNHRMGQALTDLAGQNISVSVFGDIFLEDLRVYREKQMKSIGLDVDFPVWKVPTRRLAVSFIEAGFKAIVVCVDERYLDKSFAGRVFDKTFLESLPDDVDPCGENGEFHTFVYDGPLFRNPVLFRKGEIIYRTYKTPGASVNRMGFWFCDLTG